MDDQVEETLRQEAINRRLTGERRSSICCTLGRSRAWFDKWWGRYRRYGRVGLKSRSRAPQHVHNKMKPEIEEATVRIRRILAERTDPELKYAFIGAPTIRTELKHTALRPVPSVAAIERALQRRHLTKAYRRPGHAPNDITTYCPLPNAQQTNTVHNMDIVSRYLPGGERVCSFHLLDLATHYPYLRQYADKSAVSALTFLTTAWQSLGLPEMLQIDNEATFYGGYRHKRIFSQLVRLCLSVGVQVVFIPVYSPRKNAIIESFNSDWDQAFWQRERFRDLAHVQTESLIFERWYRTRYEPPALQGLTPTEARADFRPRLLPVDFDPLAPRPLTAGTVHFLRLINSQGQVNVLNEGWLVKPKLAGEYVWVTIATADQRLSIYHQQTAQAARELVIEYDYEIAEKVQPLVPIEPREKSLDNSG
jgi:putative transposase